MKQFLVIQTASIGDVILCTPILEKLHKQYPDAAIDVLIKKPNESLFKGHPFVRNLLVWDKKDKKYRRLLELLFTIQDTNYDAVINLQRFASTGILTAFSKAIQRIGFNKNPFSFLFTKRVKHRIGVESIHEVDRNLDLIEHLCDDQPAPMKLYPEPAAYAKVSPYKTQEYICIAPASLWYTKQYPKEKWVDFINQLPTHLNVFLLGGPSDNELCKWIIKESSHQNTLNLSGKLSLLETAALMEHARMNYTNDSAPLHLCSAVNAPITAVFCSTVPNFGFGPLSDNREIIQIKHELSCRPCGLHGFRECPKKHFKCATEINTEDLIARL